MATQQPQQPTNPNTQQKKKRDTTLNIAKFLAMFGTKSPSGFQGHAYIILQVIRFCNVAVLLAVMAASVLMLIFAKLPNGFQFFADVVHALVFFFAALLIYTEIGVWRKGQEFIARAWPMLGPDRGFSGLGAIMILIGCHLLGGLNSGLYTSDDVPSQISQVIIGAGIISLAFGFTNIFASLVFKSADVRAREIREAGATTRDLEYGDGGYSSRSNSTRKPNISGPIRMDSQKQFAKGQPHEYYGEDAKSLESYETRHSPIAPDYSRPPSAMHPANREDRNTVYSEDSLLAPPNPAHLPNRNTSYSEASHIDRFGPHNTNNNKEFI